MHSRKSPTDLVRQHIVERYLLPARKRGSGTVRVVAGDIHRALGLTNRVPLVCAAMKAAKFLQENRLAIESVEGPPSGQSTTLTITYRFLPGSHADAAPVTENPLLQLRGIAREVFQSLGGGVAFIRSERAEFQERPTNLKARTE